MTLALELADLARTAPDGLALDYLRGLTATNIAAAMGELGASARLIDALPIDVRAPAGAAFAYGARLHARTQDDFHPLGRVHVGAVSLASTLALAEHVQTRTLECLAAGYEVMCAVAVTYASSAQRRGFRPSGVFGPLASAAAAATALGLDRDGIANAIGLAAARSGGTNQSWLSGTDEWLLEVGHAARAGVEAALLTVAGARAAPDALEGKAGWAKAFFDDEAAGRLRAVLSEGRRSRIREVAVKPYPVSGIAQTPTHLACEARELVQTAKPEEIVVRLSPSEASYPGSENRGPFRSRSDALMSVVFCVACGLTDGFVSLRRLEQPNDLAEVIERIRLESDPSLEERNASLEMIIAGERIRFTADGGALLHPSWPTLAAHPDELAGRSEAQPTGVAALCRELMSDAVDARRLCGFMTAGRQGAQR